MRKRAFVLGLALTILLLAPSPASARSQALCGFRCNIEHLDICVHTGERNYACWEMAGGCMSGGYSCDEGAW